MIYYIFRHGETFYTKNNFPYGENFETAEILPESVPVIERIGEYLKDKIADNNYTSPFKRALQTVEIVEKITGKKFVVDERLREEGLSRAKESINQLEERLNCFVADMDSKNVSNIAVCSHGWPIAALIAILTKGNVTKMDLSCFPKCGVLTVIEGKSIKTLDFN
jgi:broad specificity phosphatase PhoE